jgi:hypothetical protein
MLENHSEPRSIVSDLLASLAKTTEDLATLNRELEGRIEKILERAAR